MLPNTIVPLDEQADYTTASSADFIASSADIVDSSARPAECPRTDDRIDRLLDVMTSMGQFAEYEKVYKYFKGVGG